MSALKKIWLFPGAALLCGIAGFGLRRWQLAVSFDEAGLPLPNTPPDLLLVLLSAVVLVGGGVLGWRLCRERERLGYGDAFRHPSPLFLTGHVLAAFLLLAAGGLSLFAFFRGDAASALPFSRITQAASGTLALVGGGCLLLLGRELNTDSPIKSSVPALLPVFAGCLWLVTLYQREAGNPVVAKYAYQILAVAAIVLMLYFAASHSFENGRSERTLFACFAAVYFSCVALADIPLWHDLCLFGFGLVYGLVLSAALIHNLTAEREDTTHEPE